jgi:hypothetical protein
VSEPSPVPHAQPPPESDAGTSLRRPLLVLALVLVGILVVVIAATALPRWWAQRIGDQVDGDLTSGLVIGFMYGFLATLLPLLVLGVVARYFRRSWAAWLVGGCLALFLAAPNLLTLWIVLGVGDGAHAGDRTLDVNAPWFRGGMLFGVIAALCLAAFVGYDVVSRRRARERAHRLEAERDEARAARAAGPGVAASAGEAGDTPPAAPAGDA